MKKVLIITIAACAFVTAYVVIRKKFAKQDEAPEPKLNDIHLEHHLTNVFSNAKKHVTNTSGAL